MDRYLRSQSAYLVDYAARHRAGLRVGTSLTEGTANFLVNRRMAKSQQIRWSRRGADLLLQVRCAVHNGALGSGFGQLFEPSPGSGLQWAEAAYPQSLDSPMPASPWAAVRCGPLSTSTDLGRPQIGGRFTQASPRSARCRPYSNSGRM